MDLIVFGIVEDSRGGTFRGPQDKVEQWTIFACIGVRPTVKSFDLGRFCPRISVTFCVDFWALGHSLIVQP